MHDTWVLVDQFESGSFHARHIQIKSFSDYANAEQYIRSSGMRLAPFLSTNTVRKDSRRIRMAGTLGHAHDFARSGSRLTPVQAAVFLRVRFGGARFLGSFPTARRLRTQDCSARRSC